MSVIQPPINQLKAIGVSIETEPALFFDENALREVDYTLYRLDSSGLRFYYTLDKKFNPTFYVSVTSKNDVVIPKGYGFYNWVATRDKEESEFIKESRACYGTLMHQELPKLLLNRTYDLNEVENLVHLYALQHGYQGLSASWTVELSKDILAFAQWIQDKRVTPIAVELMLKSDKYGFAGSIDLVCELNFGKKRVIALVDYKSSKKGNFYESHEVQLKDYLRMWNENFPEKKATMCFNYSGKDWRTSPTYDFVNQTDKCSDAKADNYLAVFKEKQESDNLNPKDVLSVGGVIDLDKDLSTLFKVQSAGDFIQTQREEMV